MTAPRQPRQYRYYDFVMAAYVCVLLCSNLIGPAKETSIQVPYSARVTFLAGVLFFPISYIFGDILTEVYGYGRDRRVVWAGFAALAFASLMAAVVVHLPPSATSLAGQAGGGGGFRQHAANRGGVDHGISVRHLREQLCAREDEDLDAGPLAVDPHRRLDLVRRAGGLDDLLLRRLLRPHAECRISSPSCSPSTR